MVATPLVELFRHNLWATLRLLDTCATLHDHVLDATVFGTAGSVRKTLAHIVEAETGYAATVTETPQPPHDAAVFRGFPELRERASASGAALIAFVEQGDVERVVRGVFHGRPYEYAVATVLLQAVNHATEHRAHINVILTQHGVEPPVLDGWQYTESRQ